ncbi:MAG: CHAT domain-containing protein [Cyanobacteria bacterium P01_E01_bin.6]
MDKQQLQPYLTLIENLLNCEKGNEVALLQQQADLIDPTLLTVMQHYADWLEQQGNSNAGWLRQFAQRLAAALNDSTAPATDITHDAEQFLRQTLQLIAETQGDAQQVYSFWAQHPDSFNESLLQTLPAVTTSLLAGLAGNSEQRVFIAAIVGTFSNLIQQFPLGQRWLNLELAIAAYQDALSVRTQTAMPVEWAQTMMNLATAYKNRIRGDRGENMEQAIAAYQDALSVMTQTAMPVEWAQTMNNLATAYKNRIRGDRGENMEQAIAAYQDALTIFDPDLFPDDCRRTARSLGNLYADQQRWQEAIPIYQRALQAAEILYQRANLLDGRADELTETAALPRRAAYALARGGHLQTAVEVLEQGRARGLSEALDRDRSDLSQLQATHPHLVTRYQDITNQLRNLETQQRLRMTSENRHDITPEALRSDAQGLRHALTETLDQIRQIPDYEAFLTQPNFTDIHKTLRPNHPLVYLVPTPIGSLALILTPDHLSDLWLDDLTESQLQDILVNWFNAYNQSQTSYQAWLEAIDQGTRQLWDPLMLPLVTFLRDQHCQQATLIPTGYLSLLPLHAAWTEATPAAPTLTGRRYACDDIHITYAPNARSLTAAQAIAQRPEAASILAIDNPRNDLPNSSREVNAAVATFAQPTVLRHDHATVEAVLAAIPRCTVLHFSCHGTANPQEPLLSGLAMSDGRLTLRDLLDLKLAAAGNNGIRLAILSACETGLQGSKNADEAISLPTGLLQAGVAGVVASLWSVSDLSTMLLLIRFYDLWRNKNLEPSVALRQAQCWLRDTTSQQKATYVQAEHPELFYELIPLPPDYFAHPFHWAAFSYVGV